MTEETASKYIKNQPKSSTENKKMEELTKKPMHGQFSTMTAQYHQQIRKSPLSGYVAQV
jgi:hypothetical protein